MAAIIYKAKRGYKKEEKNRGIFLFIGLISEFKKSMSDQDQDLVNDNSDWQLLAEYLIPAMEGRESQVANQVAGILHPLGLEPGQRNQILFAINQALENLEDSSTPLHLRISISGVALEEMLPGSTLDRQKVFKLTAEGLGFFLVKRIVDQVQDQGTKKYRLLEVLIYRE